MNNLKIFFTSFLQVGLVAINTVIIMKGYIIGIFTISVIISFIWSYNVSKIALSDLRSKLFYSFGAGFGSVCGYLIVNYFLK